MLDKAEEPALIAQEKGSEVALETPLGESDAAQGFWYILLLNSGASFTSCPPWQHKEKGHPAKGQPS